MLIQVHWSISRKSYYLRDIKSWHKVFYTCWVQSQSPLFQTSTKTSRIWKMLAFHGPIPFIQSVVTYKKKLYLRLSPLNGSWPITHDKNLGNTIWHGIPEVANKWFRIQISMPNSSSNIKSRAEVKWAKTWRPPIVALFLRESFDGTNEYDAINKVRLPTEET